MGASAPFFLTGEKMKIHYLYQIVNKVNSKLYFGVTVDPKSRELDHLSTNRNCQQGSSLLRLDLLSMGADVFEFSIIAEGNAEQIYKLEQEYVTASTHPIGYNICSGGKGGSFTGINSGELNTKAKLTTRDVIYIRELLIPLIPTPEAYRIEFDSIVHSYNVISKTIRNVLTGRTWKSVPGWTDLPLPKVRKCEIKT